MRSSGDTLIELRDLYRIPLWTLMKPVYRYVPISLLFRLVTVRGSLDWLFSSSRKGLLRTLERHLGDAATERELRLIARRYHQFRRRGQLARLWPQIRDFAGSSSIEVEGLHHLDQALERGSGAVLVTAHYGYARMIKPILSSRGRRTLLVGPRPDGAGVQDYPPFFTRVGSLVHTRMLRLPRASSTDQRWSQTVGVDLVAEVNLRPHLAALARNETLIILTDGRAASTLRQVPVLGIDVRFASGAVSLARNVHACALPTFVVDDPGRGTDFRFRLVIGPALDIQVTGDASADHAENLRRFARVYEEQARTHPHNWHWAWVRDGAFSNPT